MSVKTIFNMENNLKSSELVLANDGSLYHIHLKNEHIADTVFLVGDPGRVAMFEELFDSVEHKSSNREICSATGIYKGTRITALSTGMGTDNIDIVVNELDAAVNIDLETRMPKAEHRTLNLIRIGTSGALHADIPVGGLVASEYALGLDGLLNFYAHDEALFEKDMNDAFARHANLPPQIEKTYLVKGSETLLKALGEGCVKGITATACGFYGPQGRQLRLRTAIDDINGILASFNYNGHRITNFEMETSAIYGLSKLLGHNALTVCVIIANRVTGNFLSDYHPQMRQTIQTMMDRVVAMG